MLFPLVHSHSIFIVPLFKFHCLVSVHVFSLHLLSSLNFLTPLEPALLIGTHGGQQTYLARSEHGSCERLVEVFDGCSLIRTWVTALSQWFGSATGKPRIHAAYQIWKESFVSTSEAVPSAMLVGGGDKNLEKWDVSKSVDESLMSRWWIERLREGGVVRRSKSFVPAFRSFQNFLCISLNSISLSSSFMFVNRNFHLVLLFCLSLFFILVSIS